MGLHEATTPAKPCVHMLIQITDYPVQMKLGHYEHERRLMQEVLVSLEVELYEENNSIRSDDLDDTVNYGDLVQCLDHTLAKREIKLVEAVVELIGQTLLENFALARRVKVCVEKKSIPQELIKGAKICIIKDFKRQ